MASSDSVDLSRGTHVGTLLRCFLCHIPLPHTSLINENASLAWQKQLVTVYPFTAKDGSVRQHLGSIRIKKKVHNPHQRGRGFCPWWTTKGHGAKLLGHPCDKHYMCGDYCPKCRPDCMIYLAHKDCWKITFADFHQGPLLNWSRLAAQTRPFETRAWSCEPRAQAVVCRDDPGLPALGSLAPNSSLFHAGTPLSKILFKVSILPPEIQLQVMSLLKNTMIRSLLQAKTFVVEMLPRLGPQTDWGLQPKTIPLRAGYDGSSSTTLSARFTTILGRSYLRELSLQRLENSASQINIARKAIKGMQFALGRVGVRGIRVSYEDGTYSPWVGESLACWIGMIRCSDLSELCLVADELRIIRVELSSNTAVDSTGKSSDSAMWYGECPPSGCSTRLITPQIPDLVLHHYPRWKQCYHLPLSRGADYAYGLTVYMSFSYFDRILSIVSHHESGDFAFGKAEYEVDEYGETRYGHGDPMHFALNPGEYLTSAWLFMRGSRDPIDGGSLVLVTNSGRVQHFGCCQLPEQGDLARFGADESSWVRLSSRRASKIHGLAFDVPGNAITAFGVSQDAKSPFSDDDEAALPPMLPLHAPGPTIPSPAFAYYLRNSKMAYGFSKASLGNIAALHVWEKIIPFIYDEPSRGCYGLRITHHDGTVETLGRWDPRDRESISKIYDASQGALMKISFHLEDNRFTTYVKNITVDVTDNPWDYPPSDESSLVPSEPLDYDLWDCYPDDDLDGQLKKLRTFDCSQSPQRVVWWFTDGCDDIGRDHGSPAFSVKEADETDLLDMHGGLEAVQLG